MFDPAPTRRTAELHRAPSRTALSPMVRSRDVLPAESGRCGPFWEALPPPPGRCATDEEIWEHDLGLASIAAELEGTFDEAVVSGIAHLDGGPELAGWLGATDISALGEYDVVEVVAGFERVASWAKARAAEAAAHLSRRPAMNPYWPTYAGKVTDQCTASTELSLRLGVSRQAAGRLVATGRALGGTLSETADALRRGAIDWPKALVITESLGEVPWQVALEVEARVLPAAPGRTPAQLRRDLERALAEVDPQDAQERHGRAVQRRRVERPRVLPDGMASVRAIIPAEAAARLDATLQGAAVSARAGGDSRSVDQLRADALDAMADLAWRTGRIGEGTPNSLRVGPVAGRRSQVMVTVGIGTLLGLDERPAELDGYGPIGADVARCIAQEGTWRRLLVDPVDGAVLDVGRTRYRPPEAMAELVRARNPYCVIPTCSVAASSCELDHTIAFDPAGCSESAGHPRIAGLPDCEGVADEGGVPDGGVPGDHRLPDEGGPPVGREPPDRGGKRGRPDASEDGAPLCGGEAPGCGAAPGGVRSRSDGAMPDDLASDHDHRLGSADRCDDRTPRDRSTRSGDRSARPAGVTAAHNLGPLCRTHHLLKTHGGFRLDQPEAGSFTLRTPTGHRYVEGPRRMPGTPPPWGPTHPSAAAASAPGSDDDGAGPARFAGPPPF